MLQAVSKTSSFFLALNIIVWYNNCCNNKILEV